MLRVLFALAALHFDPGAKAHVLVFARTDCPLTERYGPELQRLASEFQNKGVDFWIVYPDRTATEAAIRRQMTEYGLPGQAVQDSRQEWVRRAHATVAPEAAVFDGNGHLIYHGRIDNRYVDFGKARPAATVHDLEDALSEVLAGKPVLSSVTRAVGCSLADVQ